MEWAQGCTGPGRYARTSGGAAARSRGPAATRRHAASAAPTARHSGPWCARSVPKKLRTRVEELRQEQPTLPGEVWAFDEQRLGLKPVRRTVWARRGGRPMARGHHRFRITASKGSLSTASCGRPPARSSGSSPTPPTLRSSAPSWLPSPPRSALAPTSRCCSSSMVPDGMSPRTCRSPKASSCTSCPPIPRSFSRPKVSGHSPGKRLPTSLLTHSTISMPSWPDAA